MYRFKIDKVKNCCEKAVYYGCWGLFFVLIAIGAIALLWGSFVIASTYHYSLKMSFIYGSCISIGNILYFAFSCFLYRPSVQNCGGLSVYTYFVTAQIIAFTVCYFFIGLDIRVYKYGGLCVVLPTIFCGLLCKALVKVKNNEVFCCYLCQGLTNEFVPLIPNIDVGAEGSGYLCTICMDTVNETEYVKHKCGTSYHKNCMKNWLAKQETCPTCRDVVEIV